ncbi:MAG: hypothetical protein IPI31_04630 [Bacteroidetes bacterium]|nr:hypothetical protein [Bacteroidota bacterium]MBK7567092.1 hypothetical protein [Bacteroidota bacterium]MBP8917067.1 hypothetical protein [Chitinophagales bacterium]
MVTTVRTLIIVVILLITNSFTFAQSIQGKWYTADSWADNSTIYCKRDSTIEFSKVIKIDSGQTFSFNSDDENIVGNWKFPYQADPKSFYIETPDSNYYFTYFFTYQMLILTGKYAYKPLPPKQGEKRNYEFVYQDIEFPGGAKNFKRWCEQHFDLDSKQIMRQLNLKDSLKIDLLINTEGKIDSVIYYGTVSKKFSKIIANMFSELPFIMPANYNGKRRIGVMTILLRLSYDKKKYQFEQIVEYDD